MFKTNINSKQPFILGAISTVTNTNLDPSKVLISNIDGKLVTSDISVNELDTLKNVTGNIQGQLDNLAVEAVHGAKEVTFFSNEKQKSSTSIF